MTLPVEWRGQLGEHQGEAEGTRGAAQLDATTANALANIVRTWLTAHQFTIEKKLEKLHEEVHALLAFLEKRLLAMGVPRPREAASSPVLVAAEGPR
jgi:hypothetical protein